MGVKGRDPDDEPFPHSSHQTDDRSTLAVRDLNAQPGLSLDAGWSFLSVPMTVCMDFRVIGRLAFGVTVSNSSYPNSDYSFSLFKCLDPRCKSTRNLWMIIGGLRHSARPLRLCSSRR